jgi:hypothetical protein
MGGRSCKNLQQVAADENMPAAARASLLVSHRYGAAALGYRLVLSSTLVSAAVLLLAALCSAQLAYACIAMSLDSCNAAPVGRGADGVDAMA